MIDIYINQKALLLKEYHNDKILNEIPVIPARVKPFLKWAGGKQWLSFAAPYISPEKFTGRYFEPFLGGASFFFALEPGKATLGDLNNNLISTYEMIKRNPESVIKSLKSYRYEKEMYYKIRASNPKLHHTSAARIIYLNRTCWNGLYRVNQQGKFNTPFGNYTNPTICDEKRLLSASKLLLRAKLKCADFEEVLSDAKKGDFVYLDPPYITSHTNNGFHKYNAKLFNWEDQIRLASIAKELSKNNIHVLISNADHHTILKLYDGFNVYRVHRSSMIGAPKESRGKVTEVLLSNYKLLNCQTEVLKK